MNQFEKIYKNEIIILLKDNFKRKVVFWKLLLRFTKLII